MVDVQKRADDLSNVNTEKLIIVMLVFFALFFVVILSLNAFNFFAPKQFICKDEKTIVTKEADCPKIDEELKKCEDISGLSYDDSSYSSNKDKCFFYLALSRQNISLCSRILSISTYADYTTAKCGAKIAEKQLKPELCEELVISTDIADCYSDYAYDLYLIEVCDKIENGYQRDSCLYKFISYDYFMSYIGPSDWSICEKFSNTSSYKDYCYYQAAKEMNDETYCNKLGASSGWYTKFDCYATIAKDTETPEICQGLTKILDRDKCYKLYATTYPYDISVCNLINGSGIKASCVKAANITYDDYYGYYDYDN